MTSEAAAAAGDEGAPLVCERRPSPLLGEVDEQCGLHGDLLTHAELVEEEQAALNVTVRPVGIAGRLRQESADPLDAASYEVVAAAHRGLERGVGRVVRPLRVTGDERAHGLDGPHHPEAEGVIERDEHVHGRRHQGLELVAVAARPASAGA